MNMALSRRKFIFASSLSLVGCSAGTESQAEISGYDIANRIKGALQIEWAEDLDDGFIAGNPAQLVTGIAAVAMPSLDALKLAAKGGYNFILCREPAFYNASFGHPPFDDDPVYLAKVKFIEDNQLMVFRLSDHWGNELSNYSTSALGAVLGWSDYQSTEDPTVFDIPETQLGTLVQDIRQNLDAGGEVRFIGRAEAPVKRVLVVPGTLNGAMARAAIANVDLIVAGESREWGEAIPYALDSWQSGDNLGLAVLGTVLSENPGMNMVAIWLQKLAPELNTTAIATANPYWSPEA